MTVVTTLTADFSPGGVSGSLGLSNFGSYVGQGYVALKLVDSIVGVEQPQLFVDRGSVEFFTSGSEQVSAAIELIQDADKIDTPFGETVDFLWAVSSAGREITPVLTPIPAAGTRTGYRVNPSCSGVLRRSNFARPFSILRYRPEVQIVSAAGASITTYGVVAATKRGKVAIVEVEVPPNPDDTTIEAYRIVSEVLVNEEGEWEKPDGWPDNPTYPGGVTPVPDAGAGVIVERVHEICHITSKVTSYVRKYLARPAKPFLINPLYNPVKTMKEGGGAGMTADQRTRLAEIIATRRASPL